VKALLRVDDKKELSNPPRVQEKELKEPERISLSFQASAKAIETTTGLTQTIINIRM
jgi:hypothetical protein